MPRPLSTGGAHACSWLPAPGRTEGVMRAHDLSVPRAHPVPQSCVNWECHLDQARGFSPSRAAAWAQGPGDAHQGACLRLLFPGDPACAPRQPVPEPRLCLEFQDQSLCGQCGSPGPALHSGVWPWCSGPQHPHHNTGFCKRQGHGPHPLGGPTRPSRGSNSRVMGHIL